MKNEVLYLLLNNYADHEAVFLASAIACDERSIKENPKYMNKVVAPTLDVCTLMQWFPYFTRLFF
mgnify:FL=1